MLESCKRENLKLNNEKRILILSITLLFFPLLISIISCKADLQSEKSAFLTLINQYRQQNGVSPLAVSNALTTAAQLHSEDMATNNYFSHTSLDGRTFVDRIRQAGYTYDTWLGENIAAGYSTAQSVFNAWKNSPGHNANMLNPNFKVIGIGLAYSASSTYKWYWTTDFGGYDDSGGGSPPPPPTPPPSPPPSINNPPSRPGKPSGPSLGHVDDSYVFTTSSTDPDGDSISYVFDWGDGKYSITDYIASGTAVGLNHSWVEPGNYSIRVMAKDSHGASSSWSLATKIRIIVPIFEITFSSNLTNMSINVDGVNYSLPVRFQWPKGSIHTVSMEEARQFSEMERYAFKWWSDGNESRTRVIKIIEPVVFEAVYAVQYLFSFSIEPGRTDSKWYDAQSVIHLSVNSSIIQLSLDSRLVFKKWSNNVSDVAINILLNEPGSVEAKWSKQFLLQVLSPYGNVNGAGWYDENSAANFSLHPEILDCGNGTRRVFESWTGEGEGSYSGAGANQTIVIRNPVNETAFWRSEHYLTINSTYGSPLGAGWYNESSAARIFIEPMVYEAPEIRHVFLGWEGDLRGNESSMTITINSPVFLRAKWSSEFYLNISSKYGEVWGGGWYVENSTASFGVKPPSPSIITYVFEGWEGDMSAQALNSSILMDRPKKIVAKWREDYTRLIIICSSASAAFITILLYYKYKKRQTPPVDKKQNKYNDYSSIADTRFNL
ncbi:MAG: CAP domain-containing protein [Thermoproteota archaeon]